VHVLPAGSASTGIGLAADDDVVLTGFHDAAGNVFIGSRGSVESGNPSFTL
jgi:hypothetical protein